MMYVDCYMSCFDLVSAGSVGACGTGNAHNEYVFYVIYVNVMSL